jgi:hypothetical protein
MYFIDSSPSLRKSPVVFGILWCWPSGRSQFTFTSDIQPPGRFWETSTGYGGTTTLHLFTKPLNRKHGNPRNLLGARSTIGAPTFLPDVDHLFTATHLGHSFSHRN